MCLGDFSPHCSGPDGARENAVSSGGSCDSRLDSGPSGRRADTRTSESVGAPGAADPESPSARIPPREARGWTGRGRRCYPGGRRDRRAWTAGPVPGGARARAGGAAPGSGARLVPSWAPGAAAPGPSSRCASSPPHPTHPEDFPVPCAEGQPGTRTQSPPRSGAGPPGIRPAARPL